MMQLDQRFRKVKVGALARCWPAILALFAAVGPASAAETPGLPTQSVLVEVRVDREGVVTVEEHYRFARNAPSEFRYLTGSCSDVGPEPVSLSGPSGRMETSSARTGPWVRLTPVAKAGNDLGAGLYSVSYQVRSTSRTTTIPLVLPSQPLVPPVGSDMALVTLRVMLPEQEASVVLPQMQRTGPPGVWSTQMIALPSLVRVSRPSSNLPDDCPGSGAGTTSGGSSGSLEWWMCGFVASLVAWVTFYMRWAARG